TGSSVPFESRGREKSEVASWPYQPISRRRAPCFVVRNEVTSFVGSLARGRRSPRLRLPSWWRSRSPSHLVPRPTVSGRPPAARPRRHRHLLWPVAEQGTSRGAAIRGVVVPALAARSSWREVSGACRGASFAAERR